MAVRLRNEPNKFVWRTIDVEASCIAGFYPFPVEQGGFVKRFERRIPTDRPGNATSFTNPITQ
jgi:hypothetical protein